MFPSPGSQIYYNAAGEVTGWDCPSDDADAYYCDVCGISHVGPCDDWEED